VEKYEKRYKFPKLSSILALCLYYCTMIHIFCYHGYLFCLVTPYELPIFLKIGLILYFLYKFYKFLKSFQELTYLV
jgi:hypothetical protein